MDSEILKFYMEFNLLSASGFYFYNVCAFDISLRLLHFTDMPRAPHTIAVISRGGIIGTDIPTSAIITHAEISVVSSTSVI